MTTFSHTAMLVSLNVRCWTARKEDKKVSAEVAKQHNTSADSGRYNKVLVAKEQLEAVSKACGALRSFYYDNTLPWLDEGLRILPAANYESFKAGTVALIDAVDSAKRAFVREYPAIIEDARVRLNGLFNVHDYPVDIESRFGVGLRFMPIPDAADFRVTISDAERATLTAQIADTMADAQAAAMRDLWSRVSETVTAMAERLKAYKTVIVDGKAKVENPFRDTLVQNLRDVCDLIPRLNFANDQQLERIRQEIESTLLQSDAPTLRERDHIRADVAQAAERIAADIAEFMA